MIRVENNMLVMNLPNLLTLLRISVIPIFVLVFYFPWEWHYIATALIFGFASFTDWLDGYLARKWRQVSAFGEFLDPVADKLIVTVALVLLVQSYATPFLALPAAIIISREIVISALREWMSEFGKRSNVAVSYLGKIKTTLQMIAIILLLSRPPLLEYHLIKLGYFLLYMAALLTLWSMVKYLQAAWNQFGFK